MDASMRGKAKIFGGGFVQKIDHVNAKPKLLCICTVSNVSLGLRSQERMTLPSLLRCCPCLHSCYRCAFSLSFCVDLDSISVSDEISCDTNVGFCRSNRRVRTSSCQVQDPIGKLASCSLRTYQKRCEQIARQGSLTKVCVSCSILEN